MKCRCCFEIYGGESHFMVLWVIGYRLCVFGCGFSVVRFLLSVIGFQLSVVRFLLWVIGCGLSVVGMKRYITINLDSFHDTLRSAYYFIEPIISYLVII